ncbi:MAG: hypothetical protein AVDCRST_MAG87-2887 [uncultured Thermomicrobiales bacterium]|uniref:Uncharacterized protein n=1 Tax=uncultured Thermomicrobiales bacterium TaxID=1645740 RepID=A0A6J4VFZ5_9BACT|nr:MAG: hypothetical protein AVDCRST_MAG87-2887 [uncultured Thermomicrobiales bacterium]
MSDGNNVGFERPSGTETLTRPGLGNDLSFRESVRPALQIDQNRPDVKNRVQWGPIIAGLLTTLATMIVLTVLGLAIGASVLEPRDSGEGLGTAAGIWGAISAIISFLLGGFVAAKSAAVGGTGPGMLNGFMVGAAALALILWLTATGLGNLFGAIGSNIGDIANIAQDNGVTTTAVDQQAPEASQVGDTVQNGFAEAEEGAWGTLGGLLLALGAATLGGVLGHNSRRDIVEGAG